MQTLTQQPILRLSRQVTWLLLASLLSYPAWAQTGDLKLIFGTQPVALLEITSRVDIPKKSNDSDIAFFHQHFTNTDFEVYKNYYAEGKCRVTAEDFANWKSFIQGKEIVLESRSIVIYGGSEYSLMSYRMGPVGYQQYYPFAIKREAGRWYLLDLESSEKLMDLKFFFAYIREDHLRQLMQETLSPDNPLSSYVQSGNTLSVNSLLALYRYRYMMDTGPGADSKSIFRPFAEVNSNLNIENTNHVLDVARHYNIGVEHQEWIRNMCQEGNYSLALETIIAQTGMESMVEIAELLGSKLRRQE